MKSLDLVEETSSSCQASKLQVGGSSLYGSVNFYVFTGARAISCTKVLHDSFEDLVTKRLPFKNCHLRLVTACHLIVIAVGSLFAVFQVFMYACRESCHREAHGNNNWKLTCALRTYWLAIAAGFGFPLYAIACVWNKQEANSKRSAGAMSMNLFARAVLSLILTVFFFIAIAVIGYPGIVLNDLHHYPESERTDIKHKVDTMVTTFITIVVACTLAQLGALIALKDTNQKLTLLFRLWNMAFFVMLVYRFSYVIDMEMAFFDNKHRGQSLVVCGIIVWFNLFLSGSFALLHARTNENKEKEKKSKVAPSQAGQPAVIGGGGLVVGCVVGIDGLVNAPQLNGKEAKLLRRIALDGGEETVHLEGGGQLIEAYEVIVCSTGERKKLRSANLREVGGEGGACGARAMLPIYSHPLGSPAAQVTIPVAAGKPYDGELVRCSHLLVKHGASRKPSSWRDEHGSQITCTREAATDRVLQLRIQIVDGSRGDEAKLRSLFAQAAKAESDCSSARQGGDLGFFPRGQMQRPFEDAAFAAEVGELTGAIDTASGVHVILRTA
jgi:NIMA-interacting peptidyl-prolyl cis-trans isomerase 1